MAKKIVGMIKLQVPAGKANPSPPIGPALGQRGLNIMEFCKAFNAQTQNLEPGMPIPVVITAYADRSFTFVTKTPPASFFLKKAAGIEKGHQTTGKGGPVGRVTMAQIREIAEQKMVDLNANDLDAACRMVIGSARSIGLDVVVTDHHRPADTFPACPVVAPLKGGYPFAGLCGTGVVWKLAQALLGEEHPFCDRHLDVVALATVADVVPLVDENRGLALLGLRRLAQTQKPGLRALMRVAGVDPAAVDESSVGFRLAPRINASGRLCRPEAALALLLTEDGAEAKKLAEELEGLNRERQSVEERILREAVAEVESWPESRRRRRGYVVAGEGWHEGVIGIVASRLVERYNRPVVLIAGTEEQWKGSGRSVAAFDLHGGLAACAAQLERFGGHRAAAGLTIRPEQIEVFAAAFAAHADAALSDDDLRPLTHVDAVVAGSELTLGLCEELGRIGPFGLGNPSVTLLVDNCEVVSPSTVGDGKHLRFRVRQRGRDAGSAIAFNLGAQLDRFRREQRYDVAFRLQENRWNGVVSPQLVVRRVFDAVDGFEELRGWLLEQWQAGETAWTPDARQIFAELELAEGVRRSLLESPTFRALLERKPSLAVAA